MMLAENLQFLRKEDGWSQEELAEKCQVSRQAIVVRYLLFAERMGLTAEQRMAGLEEIFLCDAGKDNSG